MITDQETNKVYISDKLQEFYPKFYTRLIQCLKMHHELPDILKGTKDIWCRDYMPVQISKNKFALFNYDPGYLKDPKYRTIQTKVDWIVKRLEQHGKEDFREELKVDGGNVVKGKNSTIMTRSVFTENAGLKIEEYEKVPTTKKSAYSKILKEVVSPNLITIPADPSDFTGHADGMIRWLDHDKVLINNYNMSEEEDSDFILELKQTLFDNNIHYYELPYNPYINRDPADASGVYINYLHVKGLIVLPVFGQDEDTAAWRTMKSLAAKFFPGTKVVTLNCLEIAREGGVLNCCTWTIKE